MAWRNHFPYYLSFIERARVQLDYAVNSIAMPLIAA